MATFIFLFSLLAWALRAESTVPTPDTIMDISIDIRILIDNATRPYDSDRPLLAGLVRLAFHDCVGGCDGCINIENESNFGLEWPVEVVEALYQDSYKNIMSRADFWAFAATEAWVYGVELAHGETGYTGPYTSGVAANLTYYYGREDCSSAEAPYTDDVRVFPPALLSGPMVLGYFDNFFNFTAKETVTILGAHTLGQARKDHSGQQGQWVADKTAFDNMYYADLVNAQLVWELDEETLQWEHPCLTRDTYGNCTQWQNGFHGMMFNADMGLYKQLELDNVSVSQCDFTTCAAASTASIVEAYAADNDLFLQEFAPVWSKLITTVPGVKLYEVMAAEVEIVSESESESEEDGAPAFMVWRIAINLVAAYALL